MEITRYFEEYSDMMIRYSRHISCRSIGDTVDIEAIGAREIAIVEELLHSSGDYI